MTTSIIRAEIRQWELHDHNQISGFVYNDRNEIFDDGDGITMTYDRLVQGGGFALVEVNKSIYKIYDDEKKP